MIVSSSTSSFLSSASSSPPSDVDLTIDDVSISPGQVAELAALIETGRVSSAAAAAVVDKLIEREAKAKGSSVDEVVQAEDLWMTEDKEWIRPFVVRKLTKTDQAKQLVKDNPKKKARAKMEVIGWTIEACGLKANPMTVKEVAEEEIEKLQRNAASKR